MDIEKLLNKDVSEVVGYLTDNLNHAQLAKLVNVGKEINPLVDEMAKELIEEYAKNMGVTLDLEKMFNNQNTTNNTRKRDVEGKTAKEVTKLLMSGVIGNKIISLTGCSKSYPYNTKARLSKLGWFPVPEGKDWKEHYREWYLETYNESVEID